MVRLRVLSSWLPKRNGFARHYARIMLWFSSDVRGHIIYIFVHCSLIFRLYQSLIYYQLPFQAIKCSLTNIRPHQGADWSDGAGDALWDMCLGGDSKKLLMVKVSQ